MTRISVADVSRYGGRSRVVSVPGSYERVTPGRFSRAGSRVEAIQLTTKGIRPRDISEKSALAESLGGWTYVDDVVSALADYPRDRSQAMKLTVQDGFPPNWTLIHDSPDVRRERLEPSTLRSALECAHALARASDGVVDTPWCGGTERLYEMFWKYAESGDSRLLSAIPGLAGDGYPVATNKGIPFDYPGPRALANHVAIVAAIARRINKVGGSSGYGKLHGAFEAVVGPLNASYGLPFTAALALQNSRTRHGVKPLPHGAHITGPSEISIPGWSEGVFTGRRHVWMRPAYANILLRPLYHAVYKMGMKKLHASGRSHDEIFRKTGAKIRAGWHTYEDDISRYDLSVNDDHQRLCYAFYDALLGGDGDLSRAGESIPHAINRLEKVFTADVSTGLIFTPSGITRSGSQLTTADGTILNMLRIMFVLVKMGAPVGDVAKMMVDGTPVLVDGVRLIILVQGDDVLILSEAPLSRDFGRKYASATVEFGFDTELLPGSNFLKRYVRLASPAQPSGPMMPSRALLVGLLREHDNHPAIEGIGALVRLMEAHSILIRDAAFKELAVTQANQAMRMVSGLGNAGALARHYVMALEYGHNVRPALAAAILEEGVNAIPDLDLGQHAERSTLGEAGRLAAYVLGLGSEPADAMPETMGTVTSWLELFEVVRNSTMLQLQRELRAQL